MSQINDQNILLKAQLSAAGGGDQLAATQNGHSSEQLQKIDQLEYHLNMLNTTIDQQNSKITFYESENARLTGELESTARQVTDDASTNQLKTENEELTEKIVKMSKDQDDLLELLADQDNKMREYRTRLRNLGQTIEGSDDDE
jgi:chromosome segregation ATPase